MKIEARFYGSEHYIELQICDKKKKNISSGVQNARYFK